MPRTDRDMPDTALPVDPRFVHPYPPVCPEAKQRLYVLPNNGSGGSNGGGNRNKHGGFAFTLFCCFCCCIVLFCIVLYCILGFSGFFFLSHSKLQRFFRNRFRNLFHHFRNHIMHSTSHLWRTSSFRSITTAVCTSPVHRFHHSVQIKRMKLRLLSFTKIKKPEVEQHISEQLNSTVIATRQLAQ